ncbi:RNA-guided endonuclease InsQ/TnpB family protein [Cupriavidus necator]
MQVGYRFRCYPTPEQQAILLRWIGCQRFIYSAKVGEDRYYRAFQRKTLALAGEHAPIDQEYARFKSRELKPWLYEVPSQVLRNGAVRWKTAYSRLFQKLGGRPTIQRKSGPQSVWLTNELFSFETVDGATPDEGSYRLSIGKGKFPIGVIAYTAHRTHKIPASITLTVDAGHWYVSFNVDDGLPLSTPQEIAAELASWPEAELRSSAVGIDRGVTVPVFASTGMCAGLSDVQQQRLRKKERARKRWQRRMARRAKGSSGRRKAAHRVARCHQYARNVRLDFAHQASYRLVESAGVRLLVFEALRVKAMSARPKAKQKEKDQWLKNQASAKAGLNSKILASAWGKTLVFAQYKAQRRNKLVVTVPPHYSSQECSQCGHTHPDNRPTQAEFVCQSCGFRTNADHNASRVIRDRGVALVLSGEFSPQGRKKTMRMRTKVGAGCSEPEPIQAPTPGETSVRRQAVSRKAQESVNPETPATSRRL